MAVKIAKEKKSKEVKPTHNKAAILKPISKKKVADEEDDLDEEEAVNDDWEKAEDDSWDPDFEEFDMPKKSTKAKGKSKKEDDDDDFSLDDDLKSLDDDDDLFDDKDDLDDY